MSDSSLFVFHDVIKNLYIWKDYLPQCLALSPWSSPLSSPSKPSTCNAVRSFQFSLPDSGPGKWMRHVHLLLTSSTVHHSDLPLSRKYLIIGLLFSFLGIPTYLSKDWPPDGTLAKLSFITSPDFQQLINVLMSTDDEMSRTWFELHKTYQTNTNHKKM